MAVSKLFHITIVLVLCAAVWSGCAHEVPTDPSEQTSDELLAEEDMDSLAEERVGVTLKSIRCHKLAWAECNSDSHYSSKEQTACKWGASLARDKYPTSANPTCNSAYKGFAQDACREGAASFKVCMDRPELNPTPKP